MLESVRRTGLQVLRGRHPVPLPTRASERVPGDLTRPVGIDGAWRADSPPLGGNVMKMKAKLIVVALAALVALGTVGAGTVDAARSGGPPNPSGQCPPGNTPGCSPHR